MLLDSPENIKNWLKNKSLEKRIKKLSEKYSNKQIVIYGAGLIFSVIRDNYDLSSLNIVGIADIKFTELDKEIYGYPAIPATDILEFKPDVILVSTFNFYDIRNFLKTNLLNGAEKVAIEPIVKKNLREKLSEFIIQSCK